MDGEWIEIQTARFKGRLLGSEKITYFNAPLNHHTVMLKATPVILAFLLSANAILAQDVIQQMEITPPPPTMKVIHSLYRSIDVLDSREDTVIGITQFGPLKNRDASLTLRSPLQPLFTRLMDSLIRPDAGEGRLVFQLRDFNYVEKYETRYCFLSATLYARYGLRCKKLADLDTVIIFIAGMGSNIRKALEPESSKIIANFIAGALVREPADSLSYTPDEIGRIDSIEKRRILIYNRTDYVDGIYFTYSSFKQMLPDRQAIFKVKRDAITGVSMLDDQAKAVKLKPKDVYAVVHQGKPFISTGYDYYPLIRLNDNLFFTGSLPVVYTRTFQLLGAIPAIIIDLATTGIGREVTPSTYDAIIDYRTGKFIRLKKIEPVQTNN
jgi:hypothetical protein